MSISKEYHVDPFDCTDFDRSPVQLEAFLIFCICVAGKRADATARKVNALLDRIMEDRGGYGPFVTLHEWWEQDSLTPILKEHRIGRYDLMEQTIPGILTLNLRTCTVEDLEAVPGIGPKTARYFLIHTRRDAEVAALDTHVLRFMREELGVETPKTTPSGKRYAELERGFLDHVQKTGRPVAEVDLDIWKRYTLSTPTPA